MEEMDPWINWASHWCKLDRWEVFCWIFTMLREMHDMVSNGTAAAHFLPWCLSFLASWTLHFFLKWLILYNISPFYQTVHLEYLCQYFCPGYCMCVCVYVCVCAPHKMIKIKDSFSMYPIESFTEISSANWESSVHSFQPWPKDTIMSMTGLAPCSEAKHLFFWLATVTHWSHGSLTIACFKNAIGMHVGYIYYTMINRDIWWR